MDSIIVLTVLVGIGAAYVYMKTKGEEKEKFIGSITGSKNLWFVVDDYGVNTRHWADFGARSSKELNLPFLQITKARCQITQGGDFKINELIGRQAVAQAIRENNGIVPDAHLEIPPFLWRAWARSALLAYAGGLYLDGSSLCLGPSFATVVDSADNILFGLESNPLSAGSYAGWAAKKGSDPWLIYTDTIVRFIGKGQLSWDSAKARNQIASWNTSILSKIKVLVEPEWSRLSDGTVIELEDVFGRSLSEYYNPSSKSIYLPIDMERLKRSTYNWFLRMSNEQILDPDSMFIWAQIARSRQKN